MEGGRCFVGWKVRDLDEGREQTLRITRGKVFETRNSRCKGPEVEACWVYLRNSKEVNVAGAE